MVALASKPGDSLAMSNPPFQIMSFAVMSRFIMVGVLIFHVARASAQTNAAAAPGVRGQGRGIRRGTGPARSVRPISVLTPDQLPPAAKFAGPEDPDYIARAPKNTNPRQMENLGRGVVAINQGDGKAWISWRLLGTEPEDIAFNLYRCTGQQPLVKLNPQPIRDVTCYQDSGIDRTQPIAYFVRPVLKGIEGAESLPFQNRITAVALPYIEIPLRPGLTPNDASAGDLDGDGEYEIVLKREQSPRDNSQAGPSGETHLEAYRVDGGFLWRINLGKNIRGGAHYTPFIVYDLDGDGRAEIACKTADGTIDGQGQVIGDPVASWVGRDGRIQDGPEYFTLFDGRSGAVLVSTNYLPTREPKNGWGGIGGNGGNDSGGNRNDRFLACAAYLDGVHPSVVMCRGYYGRSVLAAWDWRNGRLSNRWVFDSRSGSNPYSGQGGHQLTVADVDHDGRDEIIYHAMVVDDNGKGLYSTGFRHGDALHAGAFDPTRPQDIEVFGVHENEDDTPRYGSPGSALFDGATGKTIWAVNPGEDVGRGVVADIDPRYPGYEFWGGSGGLRNLQGESIGPAPRTRNFVIAWDGDLLTELLDGIRIYKWDWENRVQRTLFTADGCLANNDSKATPCLSADLFGDWREEVVWRTADNRALRIYTTTIPTRHRLITLMHDPEYRLAIAWQNAGYNQSPHLDFYLGDGMKAPPRSNIILVRSRTSP
jgi:rhamnogalacturonan endolyase